MDVVVPFDATEPKTRLSAVLDDRERREFAESMCRDVLDSVRAAGGEPTVLATDSVEMDAPVAVDDRPLSAAVNDRLADADGPLAVVMADLALATPEALGRVFDADGDVVLVAGRGGGTNVIVSRIPDFRVDYHGVSIADHRKRALDVGVTPTEVDSYALATDVDEPEDLVEVLLHGEGRVTEWLRERGFEPAATDGRVRASRD